MSACAAARNEERGGDDDVDFGAGGGGAACNATVFQGQSLPLDLLAVVQVSADIGSQPEAIVAALESFTTSPDAIGVGMGLTQYPRFNGQMYGTNQYVDCAMLTAIDRSPEGCHDADVCECRSSPTSSTCGCWTFDQCAPADYLIPDVDIAPLPGAAMAIQQSIRATDRSETPLGHAFAGASQYLSGWALNHPDHNAAIVLIGDRQHDTEFCPDDANAAQYAAEAANGRAAIRSYVLAVGDTLQLDPIAAAGGSVEAVAVGALTEAGLAAALATVRDQARGCAYAIPRPSEGSFDPKQVNVRVKGSSDLQQVASAADCASGGWYYDDPADPRKILLCHQSCADLGDTGHQVEVLIGCPTQLLQ
jgi:hypothetical protein